MAERDTSSDEIRINKLLGLNERSAPNALQDGQFESLEGLYPESVGLLARIPGKTLFRKLLSPIRQIHQTNDGSGNIIIQTRDDLQLFTLDELLLRAYTPTVPPTSLAASEEEFMSMAILVHREANTVDGGALGLVVNTYYTRKVTNIIYNSASTVVSLVANQIQLATGTYRIDAAVLWYLKDGPGGAVAFLYNVTDAKAEPHKGGAEPILGSNARLSGGAITGGNFLIRIMGEFEVIGGPKLYEIRQAMTPGGGGGTPGTGSNSVDACGKATGITVALPAGAAPQEQYLQIKLLKV